MQILFSLKISLDHCQTHWHKQSTKYFSLFAEIEGTLPWKGISLQVLVSSFLVTLNGALFVLSFFLVL